MSDLSELFDRARGADIASVAGVKLVRQGRRLRGPCPLCKDKPRPAPAVGAPVKRKRSGPSTAFSVDPYARLFKCFSCGKGGDVIRLEQEMRGGSPREAAERLVGGSVPVSPATTRLSEPRRAEGENRPSSAEKVAREILDEAQRRILGTPVEAYLLSRGISHHLIRHLDDGWLRFHPAAKWGFDPARREWIRAPAMVAAVTGLDGKTGGAHVTYLRPDGRGKAALAPAKRMWGPQKDSCGRPGGVWLTSPLADGPLIVAEGIESALSAAELMGRPCRIVAALSLEALQGGMLTDKWGRIDPASVSADPARPAFVWEEPSTRPWGEVLVAVDRDMRPITRKVRKPGGGTAEIELDAETRARICAGLAVQAWKRAGAKRVRAIAPGAGRDFNDELRERAA